MNRERLWEVFVESKENKVQPIDVERTVKIICNEMSVEESIYLFDKVRNEVRAFNKFKKAEHKKKSGKILLSYVLK